MLEKTRGLLLALAAIPPLHFTETSLDNGLRVIIAPDPSAPVFSIAVTYDTGSASERPGRTGFAHLFEHMMFQGSENVGKGEHFIQILNNGGGMNGTTDKDRTNYYETLPKNQLDLALFLEADRMRSLNVNQINLDNQRQTVKEERRRGIDNQPYGKSMLAIDELLHDNFAYKHSVIGEMEDLDAASLADVSEFFRIYYAPNNAVLTLVGDVDAAEALRKVKRYFGGLPRQPTPPRPDLAEPERRGERFRRERRRTINDPLARLPRLFIAYLIPPGNTPDNDALQLLAAVLGQGQSSRLYQRLVKDKELATSISVDAEARRGDCDFVVDATPRPGVSPETLERAIADEIEAVGKGGIATRELAKALRLSRRAIIESRQSSLSTATQVGEYAVVLGDAGLINTYYDRLSAVTVGQVQAVARKYLVDARSAVITTLPQRKD